MAALFIGYDNLEDWAAAFARYNSPEIGDIYACLMGRDGGQLSTTLFARLSFIEAGAVHYWQMPLANGYPDPEDRQGRAVLDRAGQGYENILAWVRAQQPLVTLYEDGELREFARERIVQAAVLVEPGAKMLDGRCAIMKWSKGAGWVWAPEWAHLAGDGDGPDDEPADDDGDDGGEYSPPGGVGLPKEESDAEATAD